MERASLETGTLCTSDTQSPGALHGSGSCRPWCGSPVKPLWLLGAFHNWDRGAESRVDAAPSAGSPSVLTLDTPFSPQDSDHACQSSVRKQTKSYMKTKNRYSNSDGQWPASTGPAGAACSPASVSQTERSLCSGPQVRSSVKLAVTQLETWHV